MADKMQDTYIPVIMDILCSLIQQKCVWALTAVWYTWPKLHEDKQCIVRLDNGSKRAPSTWTKYYR